MRSDFAAIVKRRQAEALAVPAERVAALWAAAEAAETGGNLEGFRILLAGYEAAVLAHGDALSIEAPTSPELDL